MKESIGWMLSGGNFATAVLPEAILASANSTHNLGKQAFRDDGLPVCCKMLTIRTDIGRNASHIGYDNLDAARF